MVDIVAPVSVVVSVVSPNLAPRVRVVVFDICSIQEVLESHFGSDDAICKNVDQVGLDVLELV